MDSTACKQFKIPQRTHRRLGRLKRATRLTMATIVAVLVDRASADDVLALVADKRARLVIGGCGSRPHGCGQDGEAGTDSQPAVATSASKEGSPRE